MAKINVKVENVKISNLKIYNCKNGRTLKKFGVCIGKYKDDDSFKFINCLYWGNTTLVNKDWISFEGTLDLSHFITKSGIRLSNVDITIDNLVIENKADEAIKTGLDVDNASKYTLSEPVLQGIHEEQKLENENDDTLVWFNEEGDK